MLPEEAYKEFNDIYWEEFGIKLSDEEVIQKANDFLDFFKMLVQPSTPLLTSCEKR